MPRKTSKPDAGFEHGPPSISDKPFEPGELNALLQSFGNAYTKLRDYERDHRSTKTLESKLRTTARKTFRRIAGRAPTDDELTSLVHDLPYF